MYDIAQCLSFQRPSLASDRKSNAGILQSIEVATNSIGYLSYGLAKQEEGYRNGGEDDLGEGWDHRLMHQVHLDALENQLECLTCALEEAGKDERMPPRRIGDPPRRWVDEGDYSDD